MNAVYVRTGPVTLEFIDNTDAEYLKLHFSDHSVRKLCKGGKWPAQVAKDVLKKAERLQHKTVYVVTSQTTNLWGTTEWLCDIHEAL